MRDEVGRVRATPEDLAHAVDTVLRRLSDPDAVLLALGGYGRRELAPHSDLDLQLLTSEHSRASLDGILEPLWRHGWRVGYATRTADETVGLARADLRTAMSLLDGRCVAGDPARWYALKARLWSDVFEPNAGALVEGLRADRAQRHERLADGLHALEPELKSGAGGLRDAQAARWAARLLGHHADNHEPRLAGFGLTPDEAERLDAAVNELFRIRCALHGASGRRGDRLFFAYHDAVAARLGMPSAEALMQRYWRAAARVKASSRRVLDHASVELGVVSGPWLSVSPALLEGLPARLLAPFVASAASGQALHPADLTRVAASLPSVGDGTRRDAATAHDLLELLTAPDDGAALFAAHDVGAIAALLPEFRAVSGRYQRNALHSYPVDVHSLHAVTVLKRLFREPESREGAVAARLPREDRVVLSLAALFHDIDKGGCDPALVYGAAERLGLPPADAALAVELVREHLTLALVAQTRDVADASTLRLVAREVGDRRTLRLLYLLTHADMASTRPEFYTDWKRGLLHDLYRNVDTLLGEGLGLFADQGQVARRRRREVLAQLGLDAGTPDASTRAVDAFLSGLPTRYFLATPVEQVVRHWRVREAGTGTSKPVVRETAPPGLARWSVVAVSTPWLLPRLAGVPAARGLSIVSANAFRSTDGWAVVDLLIASPDERASELDGIESSLALVVSGAEDPEEALRKRERPGVLDRPLPMPDVAVSYDLWSSDCYTIFDVEAPDRAGLFYRTSRVLAELGVDVELARVGTDGPAARIGFHVHRRGDKLSLDEAHEAWRALQEAARGF